jgi:hypothetical protein
MRHNNTHTIIILDTEDRRKWTVLSTGTVNEIKTVKFKMKLITVFRITYNTDSWSRTHYEIKLYLSYDPAVLSRFHSHSALIINVEKGHILRDIQCMWNLESMHHTFTAAALKPTENSSQET